MTILLRRSKIWLTGNSGNPLSADLITKNHSKEPEEIKSKFFSSLDSWLNGGIPDDDVTLVIVKKVD